MNKTIFIYWGQKFINAPIIVKKCIQSCKLKNPTWEIIELDDDNLIEYINIKKEIPNIYKKTITYTSYSDIIRIFILAKYGGCWYDATIFCNQSLDNWINKYISNGFFAFNKPEKDRLISTWFLYAEKNNYIIKKWKDETISYWKNNDQMHNYFWFHYLFNDLYDLDYKFKELWDSSPKISADGPHYILYNGIIDKLSDNVKNHIDNIKTPLYKLTYKCEMRNYDVEKCNDNSNLNYLLNTIYSNTIYSNTIYSNKNIFIIWFQGFDNMPEICKICYNSWKYKNPNWKIHFIDNSNINEYIDPVNLSYIKKFSTLTTQCDLMRIYLLGKYGGIYTDITDYCNIPLDKWINDLIYVDNIWLHWDFDSILPTFNFIISKSKNNIFNNIYEKIVKDITLYNGEYLRIIKKFFNLMPKKMKQLKEYQIGKSSNNTNPKQGIKIIANSFKLMNENTDKIFESALIMFPFFKLTYKGIPPGKLSDVFNKESKLLKLIKNDNFINFN